MSIVNMSVDTKTRQVVVAVDGVVVPAVEAHLSKFVFADGEVAVDLSYTVKSESDSGLVETRRFSLPTPEDAAVASLDKNGLVSNIEPDSKTFSEHLQAFLQKKPKN
ncbi:hypothetical protein LCGC14_1216450 [marine sediment metagenome]|uniref:Uncharacterized protein n=1 Tax=marine sediment metagenome TaxID=412755 RepID=A0A0F9LZX1_9ZZZZ